MNDEDEHECPQCGGPITYEEEACPYKEGLGALYEDSICSCCPRCRKECEYEL